jgi:predicted ArsR family transcriptional regulator
VTDEPPPDPPREHVQSEEERTADAEAVLEALHERDSLDAAQLAGNTGIDVPRVDAALDRLQRDGRVHLTYLRDGTAIASMRKARG